MMYVRVHYLLHYIIVMLIPTPNLIKIVDKLFVGTQTHIITLLVYALQLLFDILRSKHFAGVTYIMYLENYYCILYDIYVALL